MLYLQDFIIEDVQPLCSVEKPGLKKLLTKLSPGLQIKGRTFFTKLLEERYYNGRLALTKSLSEATDVATTADCWTSRRKSYLGETVHWFDEQLNRKSACLAIRRIIGSHSHDVLAKMLESIHVQYHIVEKISVVTTDNGSNFLKAFREYGPSKASKGLTSDSKQSSEVIDDVEIELEVDIEEDADMVFISIGDILDESQSQTSMDSSSNSHSLSIIGTTLPPHRRCSCHLINLVCKVDVEKIKDKKFKNLKRSVDGKLQAIWNKQTSSSNNSDIILEHLEKLFIVKNDTRWNTMYNAFYRVRHFLLKKPDKLRRVFDELHVPQLQPIETQYIMEYIKVMKPMAEALDVLQGEKNVGMGYLLPTLSVLLDKLDNLKKHKDIKNCQPLVQCLITSITYRYVQFQFFISSILHNSVCHSLHYFHE